jgi:RNA polymerase sigma factor (sigma-70 family)
MSPDTSRTVLLGKPDAYLVERARAGSDVAFAEIVARYRTTLLRYCSRYLSRPRAEDAVQQTFIRAMQWLRTGAEVRELRPWLYAIARNVALNELGKSGWDYDELPEGWEDRSGNDDVERRAAVRETLGAVAALPDRQRRALLRSAVDGCSPATIAVELGVSEGAVRQLVHRARVTVRAAVGAVLPAPVAWLFRRVGAGVARIGPSSSAATPLTPKLAAVVVAAITTGVPLAAIVHQATQHPARPMLTAVHRTHPFTSLAVVRPDHARKGGSGGAGQGTGPASIGRRAGPTFALSPPRPNRPKQTKRAAPAPAAPNPIASQASSDQTPADPGTTPACDPSTDPSCGGTTGGTGCDPTTDPNCGGTTGGTGCDPTTDPNCGGTTGGTGCDPTTDPTCSGTAGSGLGGTGAPGGTAPAGTAPAGNTPDSAPAQSDSGSAGGSSDAAGGSSPSAASAQVASSGG